MATAEEDGQVEKEGHFDHKTHHYEGNERNEWHPYDRKSGTGRGRGSAKGGRGKANWGREGDELDPRANEGVDDEKKVVTEG